MLIPNTIVQRADQSSQSVLASTTQVSAAQILAFDVTPIQLLPAPGGRLAYIPWGMDIFYRFVTTPYNEVNMDVVLGWGDTFAEVVAAQCVNPLAAGSLTPARNLFLQTEDYYVPQTTTFSSENFTTNMFAAALIENQPLSLVSGITMTGGDGTLTIRIFYNIINGAP